MAKSESMQVFQSACDSLAGVLTPHGFTYRKAQRKAQRQSTLFEHIVTFGTSRSVNSLPGHIQLEVRALAKSTALADYRREAGIVLSINDAVLFSTTIENVFRAAPPYIRYDVGDSKTRADVLAHIEEVLRTDILRAFALVESPRDLREVIDAGAVPCLVPEAIRDYFACFGAAP